MRLRFDLGHVIGIVLSHSDVRVTLADLRGNHGTPLVEPWDVENDLHGALARVAKMSDALADANNVQPEAIAAIGAAIAAPLQFRGSTASADRRAALRVDLGGTGFSPTWLNIDPLAAVTNHFGALPEGDRWRSIPVHIDNDANLGALGEMERGAGRGHRNVIYVRIEDGGIGAGLVFDGRVYRGAGGIAGELGHVVVEPNSQIVCPRCGRACLEATIASMTGWCDRNSQRGSLEELLRAAIDGDQPAIDVVKSAAAYLGRALAGFVMLLDVERVLIGGPFPPQAYSLVIPPLVAELDALTISPVSRDYVLELGTLRDDAILEGAIWLALGRTRVDYLLRRATDGHKHAPRDRSVKGGSPAVEKRASR